MKEMRQNEKRRLVIRDCGRAMNLTVLLYAVTELLGGLLTTYTATILGSFADAVLAQSLMVGRNELLRLLVCIFFAVGRISAFDDPAGNSDVWRDPSA